MCVCVCLCVCVPASLQYVQLVEGLDVYVNPRTYTNALQKLSGSSVARYLVRTIFTEEVLASHCARGMVKGGRPALDAQVVDAVIGKLLEYNMSGHLAQSAVKWKRH